MIRMSLVFVLLLMAIVGVDAGCLSNPVSTRVGIKTGLTICTDDQGDAGALYKGTGMHVGIGMGTDFFRLVALDMTPQFRTISLAREQALYRRVLS